MSIAARLLYENAMQIPESERALLAAMLIKSLDTSRDEDTKAAWDVEIQRRLSELDDGIIQPIPWDDARRMIREAVDGAIEG